MPQGDVFENPRTGERAVVLVPPDQNPDRRLVAHLIVAPGGRVLGEHRHPTIRERFSVVSGLLGVRRDGATSTLRPGESADIPAGAAHDWWNAGPDEANVVVEITPGDRFQEMITTLWGLARDGKTDADGKPGLLQLAVVAREYDDVMRLTSPPRAVQVALFGLLAPLGRLRGYRASYPRYAQPVGHVVPDLAILAAAGLGAAAQTA